MTYFPPTEITCFIAIGSLVLISIQGCLLDIDLYHGSILVSLFAEVMRREIFSINLARCEMSLVKD